jgi:hypothetical protein
MAHKEKLRTTFILHKNLMKGLRPGPLTREPKKVMTLISNCWQTAPAMRPSAKEVSDELKEIRCQRYFFLVLLLFNKLNKTTKVFVDFQFISQFLNFYILIITYFDILDFNHQSQVLR